MKKEDLKKLFTNQISKEKMNKIKGGACSGGCKKYCITGQVSKVVPLK